jgi:hypothetical protein
MNDIEWARFAHRLAWYYNQIGQARGGVGGIHKCSQGRGSERVTCSGREREFSSGIELELTTEGKRVTSSGSSKSQLPLIRSAEGPTAS